MCDNCGCSTEHENIFLPQEVKIVKTRYLTDTEKLFTLKTVNGAPFVYEPGQILEVSLFGYGEIPIGIASSPTRTNSFDIVIRGVGRVSNAINALKEGDSLFIRGPLGHGFDVNVLRNQNVLIVAGGIGLAPTRSLVQYIMDRRSEFKDFTLFYGTKTPALQLFKEELKEYQKSKDVNYFASVDTPDETWSGDVCVITKLFPKANISADTRVIICGPPIMFKFVIAETDKLGISRENVYVDLERRMKCGVGKCGHCQINDKYVCTDGPVFSYASIENLEEAL